MTVSVAELRANMSHYLERVEHGEEIEISRRGEVIAKLMPSKKPAHDLIKEMDEFYDEFDFYEEGNAVVEARKEYRY